jgi:hypothetical protein
MKMLGNSDKHAEVPPAAIRIAILPLQILKQPSTMVVASPDQDVEM